VIPAEAFLTSSLRGLPKGGSITRILAAAIAAVEPGEAVRRHVRLDEGTLSVAGGEYELGRFDRIRLLGLGKASVAMSAALAELLGDRLAEGLVITKQPPPGSTVRGPLSVVQGGHPIPDERSLAAGKRVLEFASALGPEDLLFCLVSGGGSALAVAPVEGVSLADLQALTSKLLACGARIDEINRLRRRLDRLKGGGIVRLANGATVIGLILSDVVGNPLEAVASGPTAPDPSGRREALAVLDRCGLRGEASASVLAVIEDFGLDREPAAPAAFERVQNVIVGSNLQAAQAALRQAQEEGFHPYLLRVDLQGEAREAAFELATCLRQASRTGQPVSAPACIVAGGETTVTVRGPGRGGRNTELALAAAHELAGFPGAVLVTLATDGEDGSTDAAGAVVTGESCRRARELGLDPGEYLRRNDSYPFLAALDDLLKPGPTGTNVNDLVFMFTL
jgi:hydroxypyruvate reductase